MLWQKQATKVWFSKTTHKISSTQLTGSSWSQMQWNMVYYFKIVPTQAKFFWPQWYICCNNQIRQNNVGLITTALLHLVFGEQQVESRVNGKFHFFLGLCVLQPSAIIPMFLCKPESWNVPGSQSSPGIMCNHEILSPACHSNSCCYGNWSRRSATESLCLSSKSARRVKWAIVS